MLETRIKFVDCDDDYYISSDKVTFDSEKVHFFDKKGEFFAVNRDYVIILAIHEK